MELFSYAYWKQTNISMTFGMSVRDRVHTLHKNWGGGGALPAYQTSIDSNTLSLRFFRSAVRPLRLFCSPRTKCNNVIYSRTISRCTRCGC